MASTHMFEAASKVIITGGSFIGAQSNSGAVDEQADPSTTLVYNNVSWNAILNSGGRADTVRCYPGTREAVMGRIENWITGGHSTEQPIFWLSGPAGAGKSAIAQSIAERCLDKGIPMANFFFFRADTTRNHAIPLAATLLFQLFEICPAMKWRIHDFITENFFIFNTSVEQQLKSLMLSALAQPAQSWIKRQKIVLILDGLDECSSESNSTQQDILHALHYVVTQKDSPFILFISSRAEPLLTRSFNSVHSQVARLYLDGDNFSSSDDIRRYVAGEFEEIKRTHHLAWTLDENWPSITDIESIVRKSSGHFIYASTVMRFIQTSPESPVLSLEKVEGIRPVENDSPFAQLDAIYTHILAKARNWPKAREILAAQVLPDIQDSNMLPASSWTGTTLLPRNSYVLDALGYNTREISSYTSDLTSLIKVESVEVKFYHTSLSDFLLDKNRSGDFFIDLDEFRLKLVPALFYCVGGTMDNLSWSLVVEHFVRLKTTSTALTETLLNSPVLLSGLAFTGPTLHAFLVKIAELYLEANADLYRLILEKWLTWFHANDGTLQDDHLDGIQHADEFWNQLTQVYVAESETTEDPQVENTDNTQVHSEDSSCTSVIDSDGPVSHISIQPAKKEPVVDSLPTEGIHVPTHISTAQLNQGVAPRMTSNKPQSTDHTQSLTDSEEAIVLSNSRSQSMMPHPESSLPDEVDLLSIQGSANLQAYTLDDPNDRIYGQQSLLIRMGEEAARREDELNRREAQISRREEELARREARSRQQELKRREEENMLQEKLFSMQEEVEAISQTHELQDVFVRSIGYASVQEIHRIRAEAEAAVAEISEVRGAVLKARMDLEAAFAEARSVRADIKRDVELARVDVLDAQVEVYHARAERDALFGEADAARREADSLKEKNRSVRIELGEIYAETSSWWSLPDWNFF